MRQVRLLPDETKCWTNALRSNSQLRDMTQTRTVTGRFHTVPLPLSCLRKVSQPGPDPAKFLKRSVMSSHSTRATAVLLLRPL